MGRTRHTTRRLSLRDPLAPISTHMFGASLRDASVGSGLNPRPTLTMSEEQNRASGHIVACASGRLAVPVPPLRRIAPAPSAHQIGGKPCGRRRRSHGIVLLTAPKERPGRSAMAGPAGPPAGHHNLDRKDLPLPVTPKAAQQTRTHRISKQSIGPRQQRPKTRDNKSRGSRLLEYVSRNCVTVHLQSRSCRGS